ncbi:MFS transporter [Virgibacillus oceani]
MNYRILILALGTFVIGTDDFVIAGILPAIANDLNVSVAAAGQLVTAFSLAYALGAPVLGTLTNNLPRKKLLLVSILIFSIANALSVIVPSYGWLFVTRIIAALAAALFTPVAMAVASNLASPSTRGKALSFITAGLTVGIVLGVPIGTWIGTLLGWRMTFLMVATVGLITFIGVAWILPKIENTPDVPLKERLSALDSRVILTMCISVFGGAGGFMVYTYISPILQHITNVDAAMIGWFLVLLGIGSIIGNLIGGYSTDRWGANKTLTGALSTFAVLLVGFSLLMLLEGSWLTTIFAAIACILWGFAGWAFNPALNTYLISLKPYQASMIMSFSTSTMYLGIALAGFVGGLVINIGSITHIGWIGGVFAGVALFIFFVVQQISVKLITKEKEQLRES